MSEALHIHIESEVFSPGAVEVARVEGQERISQLFDLEILVVSKDPAALDLEEIIGAEASLVFERDGVELRRMFGMIASVNDRLDTETAFAQYRLRFVPRAFRLTFVEMCEIYLDLSVPDVVRQKLGDVGLMEGLDFEVRLLDSYPVRDFVVQYQETDLAFVSRLTEHVGISFFFEHTSGRDVLVFTDMNEGFHEVPGAGKVPFRQRGERRDVYDLEETLRMIPGLYAVQDYNYRTPQVLLNGSAKLSVGTGGVVEYGTHVKTPEEATRMALVRSEEQLAGRRVFEGASDVAALQAGAKLTLVGHPRGDLELLVVEADHQAALSALGHGAVPAGYHNRFKAVLASRRFRPARVTPKPRIHGVVTGIVDAENKDGQYAEVDDQGRYRVRFLFDVTGAGGVRRSRFVRMAQPHSGPGYGMHFPLRPGVEVILTFVDGDPDRPIITATVPNPQTASPVTAGNAPRNVIRTGGGNEINFDDTEGSERIKLSTPHSATTFQLGRRNAPEDGAILTTAGASTTVASTGVSTFGSFGATFSAAVDFLWSNVIVNTAAVPKLEIVPSGLELISGMIEFGQGIVDTTLEGLNVAEKASLQRSKKAATEAEEAEEECNTCRVKARAELMKQQPATPGRDTTPEKEAEYKTKVAHHEALVAAFDEYDRGCNEDNARYGALIGAMGDRNSLLFVDCEEGNLSFDKSGNDDCDNALAEYDVTKYVEEKQADANERWKDEWAIAERVTDPSTTKTRDVAPPPDATWMKRERTTWPANAGQYSELGERYENLADKGGDTKEGYIARYMVVDSRTAGRETLNSHLTSDSEKNVLSHLDCEACTSLGQKRINAIKASDDYAAQLRQSYGPNAIELRRAQLSFENLRTAASFGDVTISMVVALLGMVERIKAHAALADSWIAGWVVLGNAEMRTANPAAKLWAHVGEMGLKFHPNKPSRPIHVIGSEKSTEIYGEDDVLVWAKTAMILGRGGTPGSGNVIIAADDSVRVASPNEVELAGKSKVLVSGKQVDIQGYDSLKLTARPHPTGAGTGTLTALAQGEMMLESTDENITLKAAKKKIRGDADEIVMTAAKKAQILAGTGGAWKLEIDGEAGKVALGSTNWKLDIKDGEARLGGATAYTKIAAGEARMQSAADTYVKLDASGAEIKGKQIKLNGKVIDLNDTLLVK
jgi:type VI secretion system secreted protein VgrG